MKAGDIVTLKSGGPRMTVKKVEDGLVTVMWFEGSPGCWGGERGSSFLEVCLQEEV